MREVFGDTLYYLAVINPRDVAHPRAITVSKDKDTRVITTCWALAELADGLSRLSTRASFARLLNCLRNDPLTHIVSATQTLFERGVELYASRLDKEWTLTDCISFVVMREYGLTEALTGDRHFEQAGFKALLL
ncbi:type II toxin-antitoxin system VapC family toxin [Candidatus Sumerlaeota bacterium]|nr:type II toxin-antitoxin system VapC family toxin [Candidatus Sumerlaeota bacterium]